MPQEPADGLLTTAQLAARPDFRLGETVVSPSTLTVSGPGGTVDVEPRVMQVLVILADAANRVVTRETLFNRCWGSVYVGNDSLNRAIAGVRKIAHDLAEGTFEIETIPRIGYRLVVDAGPESVAPDANDAPAALRQGLTRRAAIGVAASTAAIAGGYGLWSAWLGERRRFHEFMGRGERALDFGDPSAEPARYFQRAVAIRPADSAAQGRLAYSLALRAEYGQPGHEYAVEEAERAAKAALSIDPAEPYARLALVLLRRSMLDIATTEDRLRAVLRHSPDNVQAMRQLWNLLQSAGLSRDALALVERSIEIRPWAAACNFPRAQLLWILGRTAEADRVIDRALLYWPSHRFVRFARFIIFAFTGRPRAAFAMLERGETRPQAFTPASVSLWRVSLVALEQRTAERIENAREANLAAAKRDRALASQAVLTLSALGEVDAAFEVANDFLLFRQPIENRRQAGNEAPKVSSTAWRFAPWLFTPPTASLRRDQRFSALCDGIGLLEYWTKRGVKPDYLRGFT